jgi:ribosome maturation factor RimP
MSRSLPEPLNALIVEAAGEAGVRVLNAEFNGTSLQVFIEAEGGVTIDTCARVSGVLSRKLDAADLIPGRYRLEVSSPGLERRLHGWQDFQREIGRSAHIVTARGVHDGVIQSAGPEGISLALPAGDGGSRIVIVPPEEIRRANLMMSDAELFARRAKARPAGGSGPGSEPRP